jgi:uncharacterized integral membrane protein
MDSRADDGDVEPSDQPAPGDVPPAEESPTGPAAEGIGSTRASRAWFRVLPGLVVLAVILVFVFQNRKDVKVSFFNLSGRLPLSVALLGTAALGALVMLALGSVRILQLRRQLRQGARRRGERHER